MWFCKKQMFYISGIAVGLNFATYLITLNIFIYKG